MISLTKKVFLRALPCVGLAALISTAHAAPVTLENPGFECGLPDIGSEVPGWKQDLPFLQPGAVGFTMAAHGFEVPSDGKQYVMIVNGRSLSQTVIPSVYKTKTGDILTLTVALGPGGGDFVHNFGITIDGKVVAENSQSTTTAPTYPKFADSTVTYIVPPQDNGKSVGVILQSPKRARYGDQTSRFYDNVRLDAGGGPATPQQIAAAASNAYTPTVNNPPKGYGVYSIGHSFHFLNYSMPELLAEIAWSAGLTDHHIVGIDCIFGSMMDFHWQPGQANNPKSALVAGAPDILTMVALFLPDDGFEKFSRLAYLGNPNIRIFIQENWLTWEQNNPHFWYMAPSQPRPATVDHNAYTLDQLKTNLAPYTQQYDDMIKKINQDLGKQVVFAIPMGAACVDLRGKIIAGQAPGLKSQNDIFSDALGHPSPPLQALTAYCFYAAIYKKSPVGLPVPSVIAQMKIPPDQQQALNKLLQQIAWDEVSHNPLSGVAPSP